MTDFVAAFPAVAARFEQTLRRTDPELPVPACPGWTVLDLVAHLGNVHAWAAQIVRGGGPNRAATPPEGDAADWYAAAAADLYDAFVETPPERETWNFVGPVDGVPQTAAFWPRRQVHETTMHTVDLDQAVGTGALVDPALATDGIAEALTVFLPRMVQRGTPPRLGGVLRLTATDTDSSWTLVPDPDGNPRPTRDEPDPVSAISGASVDLLTAWWKRTDGAALEFAGDGDLARAFLAQRLTP